jgi:putative two-component system response regulator
MASPTILVADDDEESARLLHSLLVQDGHRVRTVATANGALTTCATEPPDLVFIDLVADGQAFDVCRALKDSESTRFVPVVIITAECDRSVRLRGIEAGADDFLIKPIDATQLSARVRSLLRLKRFTDELESAESLFLGLGATIEARDPCTRGHCQRLARYATALGRALSLDRRDLEALGRGGFLHDIGKIAVPDNVLLKTGALDGNETRVMREHPIIGDTLCAGLRSLRPVRPIVRHHHERLDGSGYPDGLRNGQVPLLAQIVGIVDVFDALTTDRPYHAPVSRDVAFELLIGESLKGWRDRTLVNAFIDAIDADL